MAKAAAAEQEREEHPGAGEYVPYNPQPDSSVNQESKIEAAKELKATLEAHEQDHDPLEPQPEGDDIEEESGDDAA